MNNPQSIRDNLPEFEIPDPFDIFEWFLTKFLETIRKPLAKKYRTIELNIIFGTLVRFGLTVSAIISLDIFKSNGLVIYYGVWLCQAIFMKFEVMYIFEGTSETKRRQYAYKLITLTESIFQAVLLYRTSNGFNGFGITQIVQAIIDFITIIIKFFRSNNDSRKYRSPGQAQYFLIFRLLGGISGILVSIYTLRKLQEEGWFNDQIQGFMISHFFGEGIILIYIIFQLCQNREKERVVLTHKDVITQTLEMKQLYCIIIGFTYGFFEVPIALYVVTFDIIFNLLQFILCGFCCRFRCGPFFCISQIKDFEIVDQRELQPEDRNLLRV